MMNKFCVFCAVIFLSVAVFTGCQHTKETRPDGTVVETRSLDIEAAYKVLDAIREAYELSSEIRITEAQLRAELDALTQDDDSNTNVIRDVIADIAVLWGQYQESQKEGV